MPTFDTVLNLERSDIHEASYRAVLCCGLPRSCSTWTYNTVTRIVRASGRWAGIAMLYSDGDRGPHDDEVLGADLVVIKSHNPSPLLIGASVWARSPVLINLRDPRDCIVSMMQAFDATFADAVNGVAGSAAALLSLERHTSPLVVRYEAGLPDGPEAVESIAHFLGVGIDHGAIGEIASALSREEVRRFIAEADFTRAAGEALPLPTLYPETHWHPRHVGDGAIGKYLDVLTPIQIAVADYATRGFRQHFGYPDHAAPERLESGERVDFSFAGLGAAYLRDGFSQVEDWGVWADAGLASCELPLARPVEGRVGLDLTYRVAPCMYANACRTEVLVNGRSVAVISCHEPTQDSMRLVVWLHDPALAGSDRVELSFAVQGARSPYELGLSEDRRRISIGLLSIGVSYE